MQQEEVSEVNLMQASQPEEHPLKTPAWILQVQKQSTALQDSALNSSQCYVFFSYCRNPHINKRSRHTVRAITFRCCIWMCTTGKKSYFNTSSFTGDLLEADGSSHLRKKTLLPLLKQYSEVFFPSNFSQVEFCHSCNIFYQDSFSISTSNVFSTFSFPSSHLQYTTQHTSFLSYLPFVLGTNSNTVFFNPENPFTHQSTHTGGFLIYFSSIYPVATSIISIFFSSPTSNTNQIVMWKSSSFNLSTVIQSNGRPE